MTWSSAGHIFGALMLWRPGRGGDGCAPNLALWRNAPSAPMFRLLYYLYGLRLVREVRARARPRHIGIILDGNRRHGRSLGITEPRELYGLGADKLDEVLDWSVELGIATVTLWVFSTDNFRRPAEEVSGILDSIEAKLKALACDPVIHRRRVRVRAIGCRAMLPEPVLAAIAAATVSLAIMACVLCLPDPAPTLVPEVARHLASTGVGNPITAVLLSFRAMDTLLEAIVLFIGLIAVWSLAPDRAWGGRPGAAPAVDPNGTLAYLARVLPPIGIVIGIYIFWVGADHPGGKFQGATILAALWLLVIKSGLRDAPSIRKKWLRLVIVVGPAAFIGVGLLGAVIAGAFLSYPKGFAKPLIVLVETALLPSLAVTLALLLLGPPERAEPRP